MSLDGLKADSMINEKVLTLLDVKDGLEMVEVIAGKPAAFYGRMANLVFDAAEAGDVVAKGIVDEGAGYISGIARQLEKQNPPRISLIGGLTPRIKPWLDEDVKAKLEEPLCPPEVGSVLYARQQMSLL